MSLWAVRFPNAENDAQVRWRGRVGELYPLRARTDHAFTAKQLARVALHRDGCVPEMIEAAEVVPRDDGDACVIVEMREGQIVSSLRRRTT